MTTDSKDSFDDLFGGDCGVDYPENKESVWVVDETGTKTSLRARIRARYIEVYEDGKPRDGIKRARLVEAVSTHLEKKILSGAKR